MFAVIKTGGKQYRVAAKDVVRIDRLEAERGAIVEFGEVLVVGGDAAIVGTPTVDGATVAAEVLDHVRGAKVIAFKKRRRKNSRRKRGHRQEFSLVRITEILTDGQRPSPRASQTADQSTGAPSEAPASATPGEEAGPSDATGAATASETVAAAGGAP
jgi:large subunit ribosomal protein L21